MEAANSMASLFCVVVIVSSLVGRSSQDATIPSRDWKKEIVKKVQEVYRPLNLPGGEFLDKIGFHHTGVIVTTARNEELLIHSYPGKAVEVTVMSLATGPNQRSQFKPKTLVLEAKPGTTVHDAIQAATRGGGSYQILHNNCNDVSARVVQAIQGTTVAPPWRRRRRRRKG